jgi:NADH-quinone oxidoreductase subunit N
MHFDLSRPLQLMGALGPELVLMTGAMILLLYAVWGQESARRQRTVGIASMVLTLVTLGTIVWYMVMGGTVSLGPLAMDPFRWGAGIVILIGTLAALALSIEYNEREGILAGEAHVLLLFASSGMLILAAARDLMIVFLGIEIMSVAVYVLAGLNRRSPRSAEGALKYFLLGSFATAFLLYGIALLYGATATTNIQLMAERLQIAGAGNPMFVIGLAMLLIGFAFKVAIVPFHMWAPDVYEGAPTPITAYMAAAVKAAGFVAFMRIWAEAMPQMFATWHFALWWLAVITMVVGNLVALAQKNIKRLLAYSSIAHGGYLLVALVAGGEMASAALIFYLFAYTLATVGAFALVGALAGASDRYEMIDDFAGLWSERPWLASAMGVFMLALLGFPIFGGVGFFAKWYMIQAALQAPSPQVRLAVILVITSVISAGYYLYVVMVMFMRSRPDDRPAVAPVMPATRWVIGAAAVLILAIGLYPSPVARLARITVPQPAIVTPADTALVAESP